MKHFLITLVLLGVGFWAGLYFGESHRNSTAAHTAATSVQNGVASVANAASSAAKK